MSSAITEIVAVETDCCGTADCTHTAIEHNGHVGWLVNGKLRCRTEEEGPLFECQLGQDSDMRCEMVLSMGGHVHGPHCGHEMVPHGDHHDYLVGSRLHHVVGVPQICCEKECLGNVLKSSVVDHGFVNVRRRGINSASRPSGQTATDAPLVEKVVKTEIYAAGICCPSEVSVIHKILEKLPGVEHVEVTVMTKNIQVEHDPIQSSPAVLLSALNAAGLQASIGKKDQSSGAKAEYPPLHVILSGIFLMMSVGTYTSSAVEWLKYVALLSVVAGCPYIVIRAIASIRRFVLDINVLMLLACVGAIALQDFHEAAAIVFLFGLAQWLEDRSMGKARNSISGLHELQPEFATSATSGESIPVENIRIGDYLIVRPGDRVPADGQVESGTSSLDESLLTGESKPVVKNAGDQLLSGSVNCGNGSLKMCATSTVADSTIAQLAKKVEEATGQRSETQRVVENFARFYTPAIVLGAIVVAMLPVVVESLDQDRYLKISLVLLVTACPCALVISTPVTTVCGISRAARKSILIKGGGALETLGRLRALTFDKTGTLTEGHFNVVEIRSFGGMNENEILRLASSIEVHSGHPIAAAIVGSAAARGLDRFSVTSFENILGGGLRGEIDGRNVSVGNLSMLKGQDCYFGESKTEVDLLEEERAENGQKACFVAVDNRVVGVIIVSDRVRHGARAALEVLRSMNLHVGLLTGDASIAAQYIGAAVGIEASCLHSGLLPEEKAGILKSYQDRYGSVGHVGDGANDSVALAAANVGIAMGVGGSAMAIEAADVALFSNEISSIGTAIRLSQSVRRIIYFNIFFSITVKTVVIVLAFFYDVKVWHAVIADMGSSLFVIANGLRILGFEKSPKRALADSDKKKSCCSDGRNCHSVANDIESQGHQHTSSSCCSKKRESHSSCSDVQTGVLSCCSKKTENRPGCCDGPRAHSCCSKKNTEEHHQCEREHKQHQDPCCHNEKTCCSGTK